MENSPSTPIMIQFNNDNQALLMLRNAFFSAVHVVINFFILMTNISLSPFVLTYLFWAHAIEKSWKIAKLISSTTYDLLEIIPLTVQIWYWSVACPIMFVLLFKNIEEIEVTVEKNIYKKLKKILEILHALPLKPKHAASLYSVVIKIPIFGKGRLPFPNFLFEDTFTKVNFQKGTVSMILPSPSDSPASSGTETSTNANTSSPAADQTSTTIASNGTKSESVKQ